MCNAQVSLRANPDSASPLPREYADELREAISGSIDVVESLPEAEARVSILMRVLRHMRTVRTIEAAATMADIIVSLVPYTPEHLLMLSATKPLNRIQCAYRLLVNSAQNAGGSTGKTLTLKPASAVTRRVTGSGELVNPRRRRGDRREQPQESEQQDALADLRKKLDEADLPEEARAVADKEFSTLSQMSPMQADYHVLRNYLDVMADIPWNKSTTDQLDDHIVERARNILDQDHYGMEKVKRRILEYLAVLQLKHSRQAAAAKEKEKLMGTGASDHPQSMEASPGMGLTPQTGALVPFSVAEQQPNKGSTENVTADADVATVKSVVAKSPILLLVGPPGVGKTSMVKSIARSLGRKFHKISLGGVRDESEIRGHRRTYVGAIPGNVIQALRRTGTNNPVVLLDEIDKLGHSSFHGDPSAAILEVLDPDQLFRDHYLNVSTDLHNVIFVATANDLSTIPAPLLDRMEVINVGGYTNDEKEHIAASFLLPRQLESNGLTPQDVQLEPEATRKIISDYTREAGVRNLERELGAICRSKAVELTRHAAAINLPNQSALSAQSAIGAASAASQAPSLTEPANYSPLVQEKDVPKYLGIEKFTRELINDEVDKFTDDSGVERVRHSSGVVNGLAYMGSAQGGLLQFEASAMPGSGKLLTTGNLRKVIQESAHIALSWVRANARNLGVSEKVLSDLSNNKIDIHIHAPAGAVPKDGPSAGVAMTIALISLLTQRPVPQSIAMTGEMTLRGKILPVGGIREKLLGAISAGVTTVIMPYHCQKAVDDECGFAKSANLKIVYAKYISEVVDTIWPGMYQAPAQL